MLIYISAPYSAPSEEQKRLNIELAEKMGKLLLYNFRVAVIVPHTMTRDWEKHPAFDYDLTLDADLEIIKRVDALLVVGQWYKSNGCKKEILYAYTIGKPVFFSLTELANWLDEQKEEQTR